MVEKVRIGVRDIPKTLRAVAPVINRDWSAANEKTGSSDSMTAKGLRSPERRSHRRTCLSRLPVKIYYHMTMRLLPTLRTLVRMGTRQESSWRAWIESV